MDPIDLQIAAAKAEIAQLRLLKKEQSRIRDRPPAPRLDKRGRTQAERQALGIGKWQQKTLEDRQRDAVFSSATQRYIEAFRLSLDGLTYQEIGQRMPRRDQGSGPLSRAMAGYLVEWGATRLLLMPEHELYEAAVAFWARRKERALP